MSKVMAVLQGPVGSTTWLFGASEWGGCSWGPGPRAPNQRVNVDEVDPGALEELGEGELALTPQGEGTGCASGGVGS